MTILGGCPRNSRSHVLRGSMVSSTPPMSISSAAAARIARLLDRGRYAKHDGHSRARQRSLKRQTLAAASICGSALSTHSSPPQWLERGGRPVGLIGSTSRPRRIRVRPSRGRHIVQLGYDAQHFAPVAESDAQCLQVLVGQVHLIFGTGNLSRILIVTAMVGGSLHTRCHHVPLL